MEGAISFASDAANLLAIIAIENGYESERRKRRIMKSVVWFRRDLRVADNNALYHASRNTSGGLIGLYVVTPRQWKEHDDANCKICFWLGCLSELSQNLAKLNIPLRIETCNDFAESIDVVLKFARKQKCDSIYLNREYEVNECRRDAAVEDKCRDAGIGFYAFHDRVVVPPSHIKTKEGKFYSVFTPYRKVWDKRALECCDVLPKPRKQAEVNVKSSKIPQQVEGFDVADFRNDLWTAGEKEAYRRLKSFANQLANYNDARNIPANSGTSLLSPYLTAGAISPRQCLAAAIEANQGRIAGAEGPTTWISELTWRDFYTHVLVNCPRVSMHRPFKLKTDQLSWRNDSKELQRWKDGKTGYPIVDAGMRQLNRTGWMHNRLRMVTAMFLSKNLLIDWRLGEQYFMQKLIDGDLAANNGGWQWSASTGTDAVPYFRIFNPFSQSKRFDNDGVFIRKMCPELAAIAPAKLHDPAKLAAAIEEQGIDYPDFVVDYKAGRERALSSFKQLN